MISSKKTTRTWAGRCSAAVGPYISLLLKLGFWTGTLAVLLQVGRHIGFRSWTIEQFQGLIQSIQWQHTVPPALILGLWIFREELLEILSRVKKVTAPGGVELELHYDETIKARLIEEKNAPEDEKLTVDDVRDGMAKVRSMRLPLDEEDVKRAHSILRAARISTKTLFTDFLDSEGVFDLLRHLYVEELHRNSDASLDPIAVADWGLKIWLAGMSPDSKEFVRQQIRLSPEAASLRGAR